MITIELKDMAYVMAVNQARSFSRAAENLFISQPALSKIIKRVESDLGIVIFDRSQAPLQLTDSGEICVEYFQRMLNLRQELNDFCNVLHTPKKNTDLRIGAPSFFCTYALPPVISAYRLQHPECSVKLFEFNDFELQKNLNAGMIDAGLSVEPSAAGDSFESFFLQDEQLILAVPKAYPINQKLEAGALSYEDVFKGRHLAPDCPVVSMQAFRKERFLFLKSGNDAYRRGLKICHSAGFEPNIIMELDQMLTSYYLACAGEGIAFIRATIPQYIDGEQLIFYKIDSFLSSRPLFAFYKKMSPELSSFLNFVKEHPYPNA